MIFNQRRKEAHSVFVEMSKVEFARTRHGCSANKAGKPWSLGSAPCAGCYASAAGCRRRPPLPPHLIQQLVDQQEVLADDLQQGTWQRAPGSCVSSASPLLQCFCCFYNVFHTSMPASKRTRGLLATRSTSRQLGLRRPLACIESLLPQATDWCTCTSAPMEKGDPPPR